MTVPAHDLERLMQCQELGPQRIVDDLQNVFNAFDGYVHYDREYAHGPHEYVSIVEPGYSIDRSDRRSVLAINGSRLCLLYPVKAATVYDAPIVSADLSLTPQKLAQSESAQIEAALITGALQSLYEDIRFRDAKYKLQVVG